MLKNPNKSNEEFKLMKRGTFAVLMALSITPNKSLASDGYWCHFVQQCALPMGECGIASREVIFTQGEIISEMNQGNGVLLQVPEVGSIFVQENGQSALASFAEGKVPKVRIYNGACQVTGE